MSTLDYNKVQIAYDKLRFLHRANTSYILQGIIRREGSFAKPLYRYSSMNESDAYNAIAALKEAGVVKVKKSTDRPQEAFFMLDEDAFEKTINVIKELAVFHGEKVPGHLPYRDKSDIFKIR